MSLQPLPFRPTRARLVKPASPAAAQHLRLAASGLRQTLYKMRSASSCAAAATAMTSAELTAAVEPKLAAVWGLPHAVTRIHMLHGAPHKITEIKPLQLEDLQPANLTKPALLEFLQSSLTTRAAVQKRVQCMVLSASAYLPSQLDTIQSLASGISISATFCISAASVHLLLVRRAGVLAGLTDDEFRQHVSSITHTTCELLIPTFGQVQLLSTQQLTAARAAEQTLTRHLRLWHPPIWADTLQQKLMHRHAQHKIVAVRSLMGPPSLAAAKKWVKKKGLYMLELQLTAAELTPPPPAAAAAAAAAAAGAAAAANEPADNSSHQGLLHSLLNSSGNKRRRPSATASTADSDGSVEAARPAKRLRPSECELLLVISCIPLTAEAAMLVLQQADCYTDVLFA